MVHVDIYQYSPEIFGSGISFRRMETEISGPVAVTTVEHPEKTTRTVEIFLPDDIPSWTVMSPFQQTQGNIISLKPAKDGDLTLNGTIVPPQAHVEIQTRDTIYVYFTDGEGGWR